MPCPRPLPQFDLPPFNLEPFAFDAKERCEGEMRRRVKIHLWPRLCWKRIKLNAKEKNIVQCQDKKRHQSVSPVSKRIFSKKRTKIRQDGGEQLPNVLCTGNAKADDIAEQVSS